MKYRTCPHCGAALDPGERCDCEEDSHDGRMGIAAESGRPGTPKLTKP